MNSWPPVGKTGSPDGTHTGLDGPLYGLVYFIRILAHPVALCGFKVLRPQLGREFALSLSEGNCDLFMGTGRVIDLKWAILDADNITPSNLMQARSKDTEN